MKLEQGDDYGYEPPTLWLDILDALKHKYVRITTEGSTVIEGTLNDYNSYIVKLSGCEASQVTYIQHNKIVAISGDE